MSFIAKVHKCGLGEIHLLKDEETEKITIGFDNYQNSYRDSYVLNYFQFNKGHRKTDEQMRVIEESQSSSNSPAFLFYEKDMETDEGVYSEMLQDIQEKIDTEIWAVLEIESERIAEKIGIALGLGIKNFIVRAGKYNDEYLWSTQVVAKIQQSEGMIIVALPRRHTRGNSFIKDFFRLGVDGVFHEVPPPARGKIPILHLNSDYKYVNMEFENAVREYPDMRNISKSSHYGFSKVRALNVANAFAGTIEVLEIVEET